MGQDINIISLKRIFEKQYIIPLFQREYSWDKDQIKTLINDIKNERKRYCLGIITVKNNKLIDGQQRLTTLYLIAIWCGLLKQKEEIKLCYELDSILGRKNRLTKFLYDKSKENDLSSLVNGWEIIKKLISEEEKNVFKEKMENNLFFYEIVLDNNVDLNHYFEVMNSRGLQLSRIDIVKSLLMQILTNEEDRTRLNYLWYTYENMDYHYDIDNFYDKHASLKKSHKTIMKIINDDDVNENIISTINNNEEKSILDFEYFLLYVIKLYSDIYNIKLDTSKDFDLEDLIDNYKDVFYDKNDKYVIDFINFLIKTKNIYDKYIIKNINGNWEISSDYKELILIQSCMRVSFTDKKTMHWLYETLKYWHDDSCKIKSVNNYIKKMEDFIRKRYIEQFLNFPKDKKNEYLTDFKNQHIVLNYLDYLLKKNSKYIKEKYECAKDIDFKTFSFQFRNSIEHFYPRHYQGKEPPEWVEDFGNLALLTTGTNIEIQNSLPIDKAIYFKRNNFQKYSLKLQIMSLITINKEDWQETEIKQFRNDMIEILNNDLAKLNM